MKRCPECGYRAVGEEKLCPLCGVRMKEDPNDRMVQERVHHHEAQAPCLLPNRNHGAEFQTYIPQTMSAGEAELRREEAQQQSYRSEPDHKERKKASKKMTPLQMVFWVFLVIILLNSCAGFF